MLPWTEVVLRLALAALFGSIVGLDRERLRWAAGLRTHMLVCVGACLFCIVSAYGFTEVVKADTIILDPSRVASQVASGIGFLGAGTILLRGEIVKGLTTAAGLWAVAAVGLAIGGGLYVAATAATAIVMLILVGVKRLEIRFLADDSTRQLRLRCRHGSITCDRIERLLEPDSESYLSQIVIEPVVDTAFDEVRIRLSGLSQRRYRDLRRRLEELEGIEKVEEIRSTPRDAHGAD